MKFTLFTASCTGREANCRYPQKREIQDAQDLKEAAAFDHVCAAYKNSYRSRDNFLWSDVAVMDCDNDHTENPVEWVTGEKLLSMLPGVAVAIVPSRNNGKAKEGRKARPRFHAYFPIPEVQDEKAYTALKQGIREEFPFFDGQALDAARFLYGTEVVPEEIFWQEGEKTITEFLAGLEPAEPSQTEPPFYTGNSIPEGSRNNAMSHFAGRVLKRYGDTDKAYKAYLERAAQCEPPLSEKELGTIWKSAVKFFRDKIEGSEGYVSPQEYNNPYPGWSEPLPLSRFTMAPFPVDALPQPIADYVRAVAESTQTPVDMAGSIVLSVLSTCLQKKYRIQGKPGWVEPLNTYVIVIAPPSERKSSVLHLMLQPVNDYETEYNKQNAAAVEAGKMQKRVLERRQKAVEDKVAKGNAKPEELKRIAQEAADFEEVSPMQLYVDDITTEKLVAVIAKNHGHAALISSEGGIFDTLSGIYTKTVNIDVMLKGYSGDTIRVDRIGRESESIMDPALTILLMAQPNVVSSVLSNTTFRGRGLTARFLYSMPVSSVGKRKYRSKAVTDETYRGYEQLVVNLLEDEYPEKPQTITLSPEADRELEAFANWLEPKLTNDYAEMADWAGKLVGNVLRLSGLLCRASVYQSHDFLMVQDALSVTGKTMSDAIRLGKYYLNHAQAAYSVLPENDMYENGNLILQKIREQRLTAFDRREAMRMCRRFKTVDSIQPVLDFLEDYGYIMQKPQKYSGTGRPPLPIYAINPWLKEH